MFSHIALVSIMTLFPIESLPTIASTTDVFNPRHEQNSSQTKEVEERAKIQALLDENLNAINAENVERYMNTMHPDSPQWEITRQTVLSSIDLVDLRYEFNDWEIVELTGDKAQIMATQTTTKIGGDAQFRDNRLIILHTLKKYKGEWKFWTSEIQSIEFLN
ncbi:MAG: hypothetical protein J7540_14120 [Roseofilum sp. SID2]|uniref:hypothetical protein n=1 Tax=unclassified Roseofilum TaxID=2620099 RepID=UPI001B127902|nr:MULTISPECIES: hypothetical protein [unclassified Roseofilum]MBP0012483.1 hypothetical protein [Roseofilum sp. SID3]MBP0025121.1 hypothetical protein [Roseofilum sp. SID2]MBP0037608.1 hypothetical protein [Roseofilum sp. SID1]